MAFHRVGSLFENLPLRNLGVLCDFLEIDEKAPIFRDCQVSLHYLLVVDKQGGSAVDLPVKESSPQSRRERRGGAELKFRHRFPESHSRVFGVGALIFDS